MPSVCDGWMWVGALGLSGLAGWDGIAAGPTPGSEQLPQALITE